MKIPNIHLPILAAIILLASCHTPHQVEVVPQISHDTIYLSNLHYDSTYIHTDHTTEYHPSLPTLTSQLSALPSNLPTLTSNLSPLSSPLPPLPRIDTLIIHDKELHYKYHLLRDTLRIHQTDSIPVIRTVQVTRQVRYIPRPVLLLALLGLLAILFVMAKATIR